MNTNKKIWIFIALLSIILIPVKIEATPLNYLDNQNKSKIVLINDQNDKHIGDNFCDDMAETIRIVGYLLFVAKISVPFLIIIWASYDFYKAVINKNDEEIKKSTSKFFRRLLAGIIVFFIPTIINLGLLFINNWGQYSGEYESCRTCLLEPFNCSVNN